MSAPLLITVLGPTASGKTAFAARLARALDGEIISADSRQVYRKMDLGTGKDYQDYIVEGYTVPCHLIDIADPGYRYSVFEYQRDFVKAWEDITGRGRQPVLCGGSGMYIESVTDAYRLIDVPRNEKLRKELQERSYGELTAMLSSMRRLHNVSDTSSRERLIRAIEIEKHSAGRRERSFSFPEFENLLFGLVSDRDERRRRITERLDERLREGLTGEVKQLLEGGLTPDDLVFYGLEYRYVTLYLTGAMTYENMRERLNIAIHQFSKRQMTWFRKMERSGYVIHWIDTRMSMEEKLSFALGKMEKARHPRS